MGSRENYFIHDGYRCRSEEAYFDDMSWEGRAESQLGVYLHARHLCAQHKLSTVADFGCGSACKLVKYFSDLRTIGVDLPKTVAWLRAHYPDRAWETPDELGVERRVDMVICADVIEHVLDPDRLLATIGSLHPRFMLFSTPDRDFLTNELAWQGHVHDGPPVNVCHIREWGFAEFREYMSDHFEILEHLSFAPQATQCVVCRPRAA